MKSLHLFLLGAGAFLATVFWGHANPSARPVIRVDRVVVPAAMQIPLFGGDRYLAADFEVIRASATGIELGEIDARYLARAHAVASELNPCHEDNYYFANAFLGWGGGEGHSEKVLRRAVDCRYWDEFPAFFLGFNQFFFRKDFDEADRLLGLAATRSKTGGMGYKRLAIMARSESFQDERLAHAFLVGEYKKATDSKMQQALAKRVQRLEGLIYLRDARRTYEKRYSIPLERPEMLLQKEIIPGFPADPLGIGYEFRDGEFFMSQIKVDGLN